MSAFVKATIRTKASELSSTKTDICPYFESEVYMPPNSDKKDAHSADHGEKKKSFPMVLVGIAVTILVVLVFIYFAGATIPQVVYASADLVKDTGQALISFGSSERVLASGFRAGTSGFREVAIEVLVFILFVVILGLIIKFMIEFAFPKKKPADAGHH